MGNFHTVSARDCSDIHGEFWPPSCDIRPRFYTSILMGFIRTYEYGKHAAHRSLLFNQDPSSTAITLNDLFESSLEVHDIYDSDIVDAVSPVLVSFLSKSDRWNRVGVVLRVLNILSRKNWPKEDRGRTHDVAGSSTPRHVLYVAEHTDACCEAPTTLSDIHVKIKACMKTACADRPYSESGNLLYRPYRAERRTDKHSCVHMRKQIEKALETLAENKIVPADSLNTLQKSAKIWLEAKTQHVSRERPSCYSFCQYEKRLSFWFKMMQFPLAGVFDAITRAALQNIESKKMKRKSDTKVMDRAITLEGNTESIDAGRSSLSVSSASVENCSEIIFDELEKHERLEGEHVVRENQAFLQPIYDTIQKGKENRPVKPHPLVEFPLPIEDIIEPLQQTRGMDVASTSTLSLDESTVKTRRTVPTIKRRKKRQKLNSANSSSEPISDLMLRSDSQMGSLDVFPWLHSPKYTEPFPGSTSKTSAASSCDTAEAKERADNSRMSMDKCDNMCTLNMPEIISRGVSPLIGFTNDVKSEGVPQGSAEIQIPDLSDFELPPPLPIPEIVPISSPRNLSDGILSLLGKDEKGIMQSILPPGSPMLVQGAECSDQREACPEPGRIFLETGALSPIRLPTNMDGCSPKRKKNKKGRKKKGTSKPKGPRKRRREKSLAHFSKGFVEMPTMKTAHKWRKPDGLYYCKLPGCENRSGVKSAANLRQHYKNHTQEKLMCPHCHDLFSSKGSLNTHCKTQHSNHPIDFDKLPEPASMSRLFSMQNTAEEIERLFALS